MQGFYSGTHAVQLLQAACTACTGSDALALTMKVPAAGASESQARCGIMTVCCVSGRCPFCSAPVLGRTLTGFQRCVLVCAACFRRCLVLYDTHVICANKHACPAGRLRRVVRRDLPLQACACQGVAGADGNSLGLYAAHAVPSISIRPFRSSSSLPWPALGPSTCMRGAAHQPRRQWR